MRKVLALAFVALLSVGLPACTFDFGSVQTQVAQVEQNSLPRQRVATLARVLTDTKNGLAAEFGAAHISKADFVATEGPVTRAQTALMQAGELLNAAQADRDLASSAPDNGKKLQYTASAAANETLALRKAEAAEADIGPLRELLNRARGVPVAVAVPQ